MKTIILLSGYARCGKDTVADYLCKHHSFINMKFARKLKLILKILFGFTDEQLENEKHVVDKKWGVSPRQAMEFVGTEMFQYYIQKLLPNESRNFWANSLLNDIEDGNAQNIVVSDLRFVHEYECFKRRFKHDNIIVVRIVKQDAVNNDSKHISNTEHLQIKPDHIIYNDGTIEELHSCIENLQLSKIV